MSLAAQTDKKKFLSQNHTTEGKTQTKVQNCAKVMQK